MSYLRPFKGLLLNLEGSIDPARRREYLPKEKALDLLRKWSGRDFGYEVESWRAWIRQHRPEEDV
jgi:hypothetical protein